jgi:hypothetical protein
MSQIVSGNTDALAAEYVLGTLDPEERTQAQALLVADQEFIGKVHLWERRLGELHLMVEPVEPDGKIWDRIKAKMPELGLSPDAPSAPPETVEPAPVAPPSEMPAPSVDAARATTEAARALVAAATPPAATPVAPPVAPPVVLPVPTPSVAPKPAAAPVLTPVAKRAPDVEPKVERQKDNVAVIRGRLTRWRVLAALMMLVVLAVAALLAAWRFAPERVPPMLRPAEVLRHLGVPSSSPPPQRRPAPPESQFDE